jgi:hypothetical protein
MLFNIKNKILKCEYLKKNKFFFHFLFIGIWGKVGFYSDLAPPVHMVMSCHCLQNWELSGT